MQDSASLVETGIDALSTEVGVLDADGQIVYTNEAWRQFTASNAPEGMPPDEVVGVNYLEVTEAADDEHAQQAAAGLRELFACERDEFSLEYPCHSPDEKRWFTMRAAAFRHEGDRYALVTHDDITDRVLAEKDAERRADRLETVADVLSHDLRNPLAVGLGFVEMALQETEDANLQRVQSALERMEAIIENALVLTRYEAVEETHVLDLSTVAERAWSNVQTGDATLDVEETMLFYADPDFLDHVLENLFRNAVQHAGTEVTVRVGALEDGFYVEDDGPGIPEADRERVFERGVTGGGGTGLGLDIVEQIADAHGWEVTATESEGGGARFEFSGVRLED